MRLIIPRWRAPGASYAFIVDDEGSIVRVLYIDDTFLRKGDQD